MTDFMIQFLLCNLYLSGIIGILLLVKRLFQNILSARMQYHLWFLLLGLLTVPFLPLRLLGLSHTFSCLASLLRRCSLMSYVKYDAGEAMSAAQFGNMDWLNDFTLSVNLSASPTTGSILLGIWLAGILVMSLLLLKSFHRFQNLKRSAMPLRNYPQDEDIFLIPHTHGMAAFRHVYKY